MRSLIQWLMKFRWYRAFRRSLLMCALGEIEKSAQQEDQEHMRIMSQLCPTETVRANQQEIDHEIRGHRQACEAFVARRKMVNAQLAQLRALDMAGRSNPSKVEGA